MCSDLGGATGCERAFLRWELPDMASSLPPVSDGPRSKQHNSVLQFCQPLSEVGHLSGRGQSEYHSFETYTLYDDCASQVGYIWLRGDEESWLLGEAVNLPGDNRPWRILEKNATSVRLLFDLRSEPRVQVDQ